MKEKHKKRRPKKAKGEKQRNTENKQKLPFSRGKQGFFVLNNQKAKNQKQKIKQKNNQKNKKRKKEGLGPSEVALRPPHLTLKPSQKNTKTKKETKKTKEKQKKKQEKKEAKKTAKNTQNLAFQLSVKYFLFLGGFSNFPFWYLGPENAHPKNTIKIGFQGLFFGKQCASRNGHFWTKKPKFIKFQLSFFFAYLLFQQQNPRNAETLFL